MVVKIYEEFLGAPKCHPRFRGAAARTRRRRGACISDKDLGAAAAAAGITGTRGKTLRKTVAERTGCSPADERCMLEKLGVGPAGAMAKRLLQDLRPAKPAVWDKDPDQWLDNHNIAAVMKQYEEIYPWFRFYGVHPIDFSAPSPYKKGSAKECLIPKMCSIEIPGLRREGIRYAGVIFNLDNHLGSGSHWVSLMIDASPKTPGVYYFDSYGMKPPKQVWVFMQDLSIEEPRAVLGYNGRRFQFGNSECGMYSMFFLICLMHGYPFAKFVKRPVADRFMLALRDWLFS